MTPSVLDRILDGAVVPGYTRLGYRLRGLSWHSAVAGSLAGKEALVTGASSGLGEAACEGLALAGARVHMLVRDRERGAAARARIGARLGSADRLDLSVCDLADLASVREFAAGFDDGERGLAVLVNNAGVLSVAAHAQPGRIRADIRRNVLGPFALTDLRRAAAARGPFARDLRLVGRHVHSAPRRVDLQLEEREFDGTKFYAHSKRAQVALTEAWAQGRQGDGITFFSMHPGWVDTPGLSDSLPRFHRVMRPLLRDARQGADTVVWLATCPEVDGMPGALWHDRRPRPAHRLPSTHESAAERRAPVGGVRPARRPRHRARRC